jgi:hypothetical protein
MDEFRERKTDKKTDSDRHTAAIKNSLKIIRKKMYSIQKTACNKKT